MGAFSDAAKDRGDINYSHPIDQPALSLPTNCSEQQQLETQRDEVRGWKENPIIRLEQRKPEHTAKAWPEPYIVSQKNQLQPLLITRSNGHITTHTHRTVEPTQCQTGKEQVLGWAAFCFPPERGPWKAWSLVNRGKVVTLEGRAFGLGILTVVYVHRNPINWKSRSDLTCVNNWRQAV